MKHPQALPLWGVYQYELRGIPGLLVCCNLLASTVGVHFQYVLANEIYGLFESSSQALKYQLPA